MSLDPLQALQAANRAVSPIHGANAGTLLIAGATGALGQELLRKLAGRHRFAHARVLSREPIRDGLRGVETYLSPDLPIAQWPLTSADTAQKTYTFGVAVKYSSGDDATKTLLSLRRPTYKAALGSE